ncbi:hypothetical protein ACFQ5J_06055 [Lacticaseibacillus baoqingensis]|uniref:Uncharacterized protein n=1 Tax=Lacticaseibacillus baoqingensis TaxID=2486013 RepID=A0ABW4E4H9_9LACO|nr:hypothetical protein [Lacticaseibacillus baoqingensis]
MHSKTRICKMPKCQKQTVNAKAWFCLEHQRAFNAWKEQGAAVATGAVALALAFMAKGKKGK